MLEKLVASVKDVVYAYKTEDLLFVMHVGPLTGPAFWPVLEEIDGVCVSRHQREFEFESGVDLEWTREARLTVYKIWDECPPYIHECAVVSRVAS